MSNSKPDLLLIGPSKPVIVNGLEPHFTMHKLSAAKDREALPCGDRPAHPRHRHAPRPSERINGELMSRFPKLEIVSNFGVGYDHIDAAWAGEHGITVTNTPDVLNEEVADTALGLLLCTVREFPQADRYVRAGRWLKAGYPLTPATLRNRTVGMVGMGRIGRAIARRLDAFGVPVVYHTRNQQHDVGYHYYQKLVDMAHAVDTLMVIVPGGAATREPDQCRGARRARAERHSGQHGARLGGRRAGSDQGAQGPHHHVGRVSMSLSTSRRCRRN